MNHAHAIFLGLATRTHEDLPHPQCTHRLKEPHTRVDFVHRCARRDGEQDWVEFTDNGTYYAYCYGNCCRIDVPTTLWEKWVGASSELMRAVLQVRAEVTHVE